MIPEGKENRSEGQLFADLMNETSTLLRQEVRLAKTEITEKVSRAQKDIISIIAGGAVAYAGLLALLAAAVIGLAHVVPLWLAALIVGVVVIGIGFGLIQQGRKNLVQEDLKLRKSMESLQEDRQWAKQRVR